jgi:hypothetical protein
VHHTFSHASRYNSIMLQLFELESNVAFFSITLTSWVIIP